MLNYLGEGPNKHQIPWSCLKWNYKGWVTGQCYLLDVTNMTFTSETQDYQLHFKRGLIWIQHLVVCLLGFLFPWCTSHATTNCVLRSSGHWYLIFTQNYKLGDHSSTPVLFNQWILEDIAIFFQVVESQTAKAANFIWIFHLKNETFHRAD